MVGKISGILPPSSRTQSADLSEAGPVRPGAPQFGAPRGESSLGAKDRFTKSSVGVSDFGPGQLDWKGRDRRKAHIVQQMTDRFFSGQAGGPAQQIELAPSSSASSTTAPKTVHMSEQSQTVAHSEPVPFSPPRATSEDTSSDVRNPEEITQSFSIYI